MKILADENIPRITVDRLRELGHDVKDIRGTAAKGLPDADLWTVALAEGRLLITTVRASPRIVASPTMASSSCACANPIASRSTSR